MKIGQLYFKHWSIIGVGTMVSRVGINVMKFTRKVAGENAGESTDAEICCTNCLIYCLTVLKL